MRAALRRARILGHGAVLLMGDAPYYARFGFSPALAEGLFMPGPFERERFLGLELRQGALAGARGILRATEPGAARRLPRSPRPPRSRPPVRLRDDAWPDRMPGAGSDQTLV